MIVTLMSSMSGAYHAFSKINGKGLSWEDASAEFTVQDLAFPIPLVISEESRRSPVTNVSLVRMERGAYCRVAQANRSTEYISTGNGARALDGEARYAQQLVEQFSGLSRGDIARTEIVSDFNNEYGFINKRLPVVKVQYAGGKRYFVETSSGHLALKAGLGDVVEGYSFAFLHKWEFSLFLGKTTRDVLLMNFTLGNAVVAAMCLWLFIMWRGAGRHLAAEAQPSSKMASTLAPTLRTTNVASDIANYDEDDVHEASKKEEQSEVVAGVLRKAMPVLLIACAAAYGNLACRATHQAPMTAQASQASAPQRYQLTGTVLKIDKAAKRITIKHGAIPGYMEAMDGMPYLLKDERAYDALAVGDDIQATLVVAGDGRSWLDEVDVIERGDVPSSHIHEH